MARQIDVVLHVWRQKGPDQPGAFVRYEAPGITAHMSFLEMLDVVNERLLEQGQEPIAFDHDCREGICGTCGVVINGVPHGPLPGTSTCQLHMRHFNHGDEITIEPWRASAFPVVRDLIVDRSALDRIIQSGGYVSVRTGAAPEANALPVPKPDSSAAARAWPPVPTPRRRCSRQPRSLTLRSCRKASPSANAAPWPWSSKWTQKASGIAPVTSSARPSARRASAWLSSHR
jgi:hypothetical protein